MSQSTWSHRDSWPPTQLRLSPSSSSKSDRPRPLLEDIDENPLTYFLSVDNGNNEPSYDDHDMLDFDAGIQDANHRSRDFIHSVSSSAILRARTASPDIDSDTHTTDDEAADDEEYIRFSPPSPSFLSPFRAVPLSSFKLRSKSPPFGCTAGNIPPSRPFASGSASFPAPSASARGRTRTPALTRSYSAGGISGRRCHHLPMSPRPRRLWREPSPDVWSISEETAEELLSAEASSMSTSGVQVVAAKPKKKVRFLLP